MSPTVIGYVRGQTGSLYGGLAAIAVIVLLGLVLGLVCLRRAPALQGRLATSG